MYTCIYVYMYIRIHVYMYVYTHIYMAHAWCNVTGNERRLPWVAVRYWCAATPSQQLSSTLSMREVALSPRTACVADAF